MGSDMPCKKDDFETEHDVAPPKCGLSMTSYSPVKFKISLVGPYGSGDCHSCESQNALDRPGMHEPCQSKPGTNKTHEWAVALVWRRNPGRFKIRTSIFARN
eukprot:CAMPEP_0114275576 /NCGR_PEP_ID=MMETSP0058-20121206/30404_1 /TAXON_ID=36894 /ORGANISM="Pyramimonas parkeae, CCMP726" /LENGTH=101 /DNA_ID=CAMNT_0001395507 /DNA_START=245 /DNA_END=547 /DNA_ORIENTATION=+